MISKNSITVIKSILKPIVDSGVIPENDYQELLKALKTTAGEKKKLELWTRTQTAEFLQVCKRQVDKLAMTGKLKRHYISERGGRFNKEEVYSLIA